MGSTVITFLQHPSKYYFGPWSGIVLVVKWDLSLCSLGILHWCCILFFPLNSINAFIKAVQKHNLMYIGTDIISKRSLQFENSSQLVLLNTRQYPLCDFPWHQPSTSAPDWPVISVLASLKAGKVQGSASGDQSVTVRNYTFHNALAHFKNLRTEKHQ